MTVDCYFKFQPEIVILFNLDLSKHGKTLKRNPRNAERSSPLFTDNQETPHIQIFYLENDYLLARQCFDFF